MDQTLKVLTENTYCSNYLIEISNLFFCVKLGTQNILVTRPFLRPRYLTASELQERSAEYAD